MNVELASPADFIPLPAGWRERSPFRRARRARRLPALRSSVAGSGQDRARAIHTDRDDRRGALRSRSRRARSPARGVRERSSPSSTASRRSTRAGSASASRRRRDYARGESHEPGSCPLSGRRGHEGRPVRVLPPGRRNAPAASAQPAVHDEALPARNRRRGVLPEAGAEGDAGVDPDPPSSRHTRARAAHGSSTSRCSTPSRRVLWMVQMNCVDMNAWYSRVDKPHRPDFVLFDLDPPDDGFELAIEVAHLIRDAARRGRPPGLREDERRRRHPRRSPRSRAARHSSRRTRSPSAPRGCSSERHPGAVTTEWLKKKRDGVLVDHRQNGWGKTIASVYSVRPKPGAPVSTPLRWDELTVRHPPARLRDGRRAGADRPAR